MNRPAHGLVFAAAAALLAAGCMKPPPSPAPGAARSAPPSVAESAPGAGAISLEPVGGPSARRVAVNGRLTVAAGDTLWEIARDNGVSVEALAEANGLAPPYMLRRGQKLVLPGAAPAARGGAYVVAEGDTLLAIARRLGVSFSGLIDANALAEPYVIRPGQRLRLPGGAGGAAGGAVVAAADSEPPVRVARAAAPPPPPAPARPAPEPRDEPPAEPKVELVAAPAAAPPAAPPAARPDPAPPPPSNAGSGAAPSFLWPVEGPVLARFGPREGVGRNDGINIGAAAGAPVRAAETGVVVYAGNELRGYGNLLLVRHGGGWTSAYAHNGELLVDRGAKVERGQVIAKVGRTGGVAEPQSHFELRKGTDAVDPLKYLDPR